MFVDAFLDCCQTREELAAAFAGAAAVLEDGGAFICAGPEPAETMPAMLDQAWKACDRFYIEWRFATPASECACLHVRDRNGDFIDDHHLYVIQERDVALRLERATLRQWFRWDRRCLDETARAAGFSAVGTRTFDGYGFEGTTFSRIVAIK